MGDAGTNDENERTWLFPFLGLFADVGNLPNCIVEADYVHRCRLSQECLGEIIVSGSAEVNSRVAHPLGFAPLGFARDKRGKLFAV